jgi:hypothetical protein
MNTRSKRSSAIRMMRPWMLALPLADGTVSQADREHTAFGYAGILSAAPVVTARRVHAVIASLGEQHAVVTD